MGEQIPRWREGGREGWREAGRDRCTDGWMDFNGIRTPFGDTYMPTHGMVKQDYKQGYNID